MCDYDNTIFLCCEFVPFSSVYIISVINSNHLDSPYNKYERHIVSIVR